MTFTRLGRSLVLTTAIAALAATAACSTKAPGTAAPTTAETTPAVAQSSAPPVLSVTAVSAPDKLGSRAKITDAEHNKLAADTEAAIKAATPGIRSVQVGYYGTPDATKDKIYLIAATFADSTRITDAELQATLNDLSKGMEGKAFVASDTPGQGDLGGSMMCGPVTVAKMPSALCGWRVRHFVVVLLWYNHEPKNLVGELPAIRAAVETRV